MFKPAFAAILGVLVVGSAYASTMQPNQYRDMSRFRAELKHCFDEGHITPRTYADAESAVDTILAGFSFDREHLHRWTIHAFNNTEVSAESCRITEVEAYKVVAGAATAERNRAQNRQDTADAINRFNQGMHDSRPVFCNRIGAMTMCN